MCNTDLSWINKIARPSLPRHYCSISSVISILSMKNEGSRAYVTWRSTVRWPPGGLYQRLSGSITGWLAGWLPTIFPLQEGTVWWAQAKPWEFDANIPTVCCRSSLSQPPVWELLGVHQSVRNLNELIRYQMSPKDGMLNIKLRFNECSRWFIFHDFCVKRIYLYTTEEVGEQQAAVCSKLWSGN